MSTNQTQNAPTATEKQPTEPTPVAQPEPFVLIPPFKIPSKAKGMAKAAGIDLGSIEEMAPRMNTWAASVEDRLSANNKLLSQIVEAIPNLPTATIQLLRAEAEKQRAEVMAQRTQQAAPTAAQSQGTPDVMSILLPEMMKALGGAQASGGLEGEITKKVIEAGLNQMFAGTRLLEAMQTKMLANMGAKEVEKLAMP